MEIKKILFFFLMFSLTVTLYAQQITVQGTVYEEGTKNPIPGANVIVKGTTQGTSTDFEYTSQCALQCRLRSQLPRYADPKCKSSRTLPH